MSFIPPRKEPIPKLFRRLQPIDFDDPETRDLLPGPWGTWIPKNQEYALATEPLEIPITLPPHFLRALAASTTDTEPDPPALSPQEYYNQYLTLTTWPEILSFRDLNPATKAIYDHIPLPPLTLLPIELSLLNLLKTIPPDSPLLEPLTETIVASSLSLSAFTRPHSKLQTAQSDDAAMRAFINILAFLRTLGRTRGFSNATPDELEDDGTEILESLDGMLANAEDFPLSTTSVLYRIEDAVYPPKSKAGQYVLAAQVLCKEWSLWAVTSLAMSLASNEFASAEDVEEVRVMVEVGVEVRGAVLGFWDVWAFDGKVREPEYTEEERRAVEWREGRLKKEEEMMVELRKRLERKRKRFEQMLKLQRGTQRRRMPEGSDT